MLELVVRLVLVSGVIVAGLLGLRHAQRRGMTARGGPELRVLGRTGLTKSSVVAVVAVDDQRYLVGASEDGVRLLAALAPDGDAPHTDPDPADEAGADDAPDELDAELRALLDSHAPDDETHDLHATHGTGRTTHGPRIGPLDRLREMTVRSHLREPIRAPRHPFR